MSDNAKVSPGWILACIYAFTMPLAFSVFANWERLPVVARRLWSPEAAGWAQAIGSLIALGIAIAVPEWQRKKAVQTERRQRRLEGIALIIVAIERLRLCSETLVELRDTAIVQSPAAIRAANAAIAAFPAHAMGDPVGIIQMSHVGGILAGAIGIAEELAQMHADGKVKPPELDGKVDIAVALFKAFSFQLHEKGLDLAEYYGLSAEVGAAFLITKGDLTEDVLTAG